LHYATVPKEPRENLAFRERLLKAASGNPALRAEIRRACRDDILFWINAFGWIHEPRTSPRYGMSGDIPFITWEYQDSAILEIQDALGVRDLTFEKSRDVGVSWMCVYDIRHQFEFFPNRSFMMVSRNKELVDDPENPDSLFWKFDFIERHMPSWLCAKVVGTGFRKRTPSSRAVNPYNRSSVFCAATTDAIGVGGRKVAIFIDEFSRFDPGVDFEVWRGTRATTDCRIFNGTPNGTGNAHFRVNHMPAIRKIIIDWKDHPIQSKGLYRVKDGQDGYEVIDHAFWNTATARDIRNIAPMVFDEFAPDTDDMSDARSGYPFRVTSEYGLFRSPWFDNECLRTPATTMIAQEINRKYVGSGEAIVTTHEIEAVIRKTAATPLHSGNMAWDSKPDESRFVARDGGSLRLWRYPDSAGQWPMYDEFVAGVDIGFGRGSSESVISVFDLQTREQVAEYADRFVDPSDFVDIAVACCRWFNSATINWETNGPGGSFLVALQRLGYDRLYLRRSDERSLNKKVTLLPGFQSNSRTKQNIIMDCLTAVRRGDMSIRSQETLEEFCSYRYTDRSVEHVAAMHAVNAESRGDNHGDRVIAVSLAWRVLRGTPPRKTGEAPNAMPANCLAARRAERTAGAARSADWCVIH
jgi:hypothetical protein